MARRGHHTLEQIKDMVLAAAEDLVEKGGLPALRVRNIAMKIGYTVGSIYMVFESLNELTLHIKGKTLDTIVGQLEQVQAQSGEQRLKEMADIYIRYARQNLNRWSMVFEHCSQENNKVPPEWYQTKIDRLYRKFEVEFEQLNPGLSLTQRKQTALAFLGGLHGICAFMLKGQISGLDNNDMEESILLLIRKFTHESRAESMTGNPQHLEKSQGKNRP